MSPQEGDQKDYNTKAYVLHPDSYRCRSRKKGVQHSEKLHVHHIRFRIHAGGDAPANLITLCKNCHDALHAGVFELHLTKSRTRHATQIGIIKASLLKVWDFEATFVYGTKFKREQNLNWPKSHFAEPSPSAVTTLRSSGRALPLFQTPCRQRRLSSDQRAP